MDIFKVQIRGLASGTCDLIKAETHFDLAEAKAVVVAAREVCDLPVLVSMTFEGPASLTGTPPLTFVDTMRNLGVEIVRITSYNVCYTKLLRSRAGSSGFLSSDLRQPLRASDLLPRAFAMSP